MKEKEVIPTNAIAEHSNGRVALWLEHKDLNWLANHCCCTLNPSQEEVERCMRIRFRANAAMHKK